MTLFDDEIASRIKASKSNILVFSTMRNEHVRLESWLEHYRRIGCSEFFVVDNGSDDGTYEILSRQPDVVVIQTRQSFRTARCGVDWLNEFRVLAGEDRWVLFADADELLVYRGWPETSIQELVSRVDAAGCDAHWAFMLDMYPDGQIEPADPPSGIDLFAAAPCFDGEYHFFYPPKKPWSPSYPCLAVLGGPRLRMLSTISKELNVTWFDRFLRGQLDRVLPYTPSVLLPLAFRLMPQDLPSLLKVPIARGGSIKTYTTNHTLDGSNFYPENAIFCHFKFLGDFSKRVHQEVARKEHYRGGAEYFRYLTMLKTQGVLDFRCSQTAQFSSSKQLEELGLFGTYPIENPAAKSFSET